MRIDRYLNETLIYAEDEAKRMGDEYVSVEHLFLSMLQYPNKEIKQIFTEYGITRERFLQALSTVRGNQRVVWTIRRLLMIHWRSTDRNW